MDVRRKFGVGGALLASGLLIALVAGPYVHALSHVADAHSAHEESHDTPHAGEACWSCLVSTPAMATTSTPEIRLETPSATDSVFAPANRVRARVESFLQPPTRAPPSVA